jgi:hypothetical protein
MTMLNAHDTPTSRGQQASIFRSPVSVHKMDWTQSWAGVSFHRAAHGKIHEEKKDIEKGRDIRYWSSPTGCRSVGAEPLVS